jgi:predicted 3-demethylubiquinone-9 3-methyltransferase (glyoxalase superfamily)
MQKIAPFLWFDNNAEEAVDYYTSIFRGSRKLSELRVGKNGPGPEGSLLTASFELLGQRFTALNGGPKFRFNESISFVVDCEDQKEVDYYWEKLGAGGEEQACGWLKDKFGLSWQVVPRRLIELLGDSDKEKAGRVMQAMMGMVKIEVDELEKAYHGK